MTRLTLFFLVLLVVQGGIFFALMKKWWPQARTFFGNLHPVQKMALAVCAFGLMTAYFFAFAAGAFFGGGHMARPPCFTVVALNGDQQLGSAGDCLEEKTGGFSVPLPPGVTRVLILDGRARKREQAP